MVNSHPDNMAGTSEKETGIAAPRLGMWLFLFTELMLFGALFLIYAVYRSNYLTDFKHVADELSLFFGTFNTVILLASSLAMVFSVSLAAKGEGFYSQMWLAGVISLGLLFLLNKIFEWTHKFQEGLYPGSAELIHLPRGEVIFYALYFLMTGLHALHLLVGIVLLIYAGFLADEKDTISKKTMMLGNFGLYWHLVDLIWIFLFPLFYLIG